MMESKGVIFGGTGFIGSHFARLLLDRNVCSNVILVDIKPIDIDRFGYILFNYIESGKVEYMNCDVRKESLFSNLPTSNVVMIANFAAIHREPGHEGREYFETNILGAENVCSWADSVGCRKILFTSSIAPYGPSEEIKTENTLPCPETAYGASKLAAEKIHLGWKGRGEEGRELVIVRPGVVFGPGEGGNVTRLVRAVLGRYFFYMGNKDTVKAGIYVKELCESMLWALDRVKNSKEKYLLYNATMAPSPSVAEYVEAICLAGNVKRFVISVPFAILYMGSFLIEIIAKPLGVKHPFSPVRIKKLVRSNNIQAKVLNNAGYEYCYSLQAALEDWRCDNPKDWL